MLHIKDIEIALIHELGRKPYLQATEGKEKIPGWMLSGGTLRFLALVALLHDPDPPSLIFIDGLENSLDPGAVSMLIE